MASADKELENIQIVEKSVGDDSEAPKLERLGRNVWVWLVDHPAVLIMIIAILIVLLYAYPVQTIIFFVTVAISSIMAVLMHKLTNSQKFAVLQLRELEKTIISGMTAGVTGFIVGTWTEYNLSKWLL